MRASDEPMTCAAHDPGMQAEHSIEGVDNAGCNACLIGQPLRHRVAWYFDAVYSAKVRQLAPSPLCPARYRHIVAPNGLNAAELRASLSRSSTEPE
jgi:hypothetical protein